MLYKNECLKNIVASLPIHEKCCMNEVSKSVAVVLESRNLNCWNSQEPWPFKKAIYHRYFSTALTQSFFEYVCLLFCSFFPFNLFLFILFKYPLLLSISFSLPKWCVMNHKTLPLNSTLKRNSFFFYYTLSLSLFPSLLCLSMGVIR